MIRNYIKTAIRNIARNKLFTSLNILGLSLGLATAILILFWVQDELSYDRYHDKADQIYRVYGDYFLNGVEIKVTTSSPPMASTMIRDYPEVINACRFRENGSVMVTIGEQKYRENKATYVDSTFFDLFSINLKSGDKHNCLNKPNYVVISETASQKYFGDKNAIGEIIKISGETFMIKGVYEDIPDNTHFHFNILMSMESNPESFGQLWVNNNFQTYIEVIPGTDYKKLEEQIQEMIVKYMGPDVERLMGKTIEEFTENGSAAYGLQKLTDIHLHSDLQVEFEANSDINNVYIFSFIALFILVIACINFMNMATARSEGRSKEVGIRKVAGAVKGKIIFQYLLESFVVTLISYFFAMILVEVFLPFFNQLSGKSIDINYFDPKTIGFLAIIIIATSLISGSYPSFYLSSFQPINALKGTLKPGKSSGKLRNILVIIQFFTTIVLISSSLIVFNQLKYIQTKDLGYEKEQLICLHNISRLGNNAEALKNELLNYPEIVSATRSSNLPVPSSYSNSTVFPDGDRSKIITMFQWVVDYDYINTFKMEIIEGRNFSKEFGTDSLAILVNESAMNHLGWKNIENHYIEAFINNDLETAKFKVVGVIKDFHFKSLKENITPMLMFNGDVGFYLTIRYNVKDTKYIIDLLEKKWNEFAPNYPFEYSFINERFNNVYFQEQRMIKIMGIFTALAIIIASLGLFGLTAFIAEKRTKEIGIRKVNGASIYNIFILFTKDIAKLVIVAFILAVPLTWYIIDNWLNNFEYRIEINWLVFLASGLLAFILSIITISYQAYVASTRNPVESLKHE